MLNKTTLGLVTGLALSTVGCVESALNPTDTVALSGSALKDDGTALGDTKVVLSRSADSACLLTHSFREMTTDAQGRYTQSLLGSDTQEGENARCFRARLPEQTDGRLAYADFLIQVTDVSVPELRYWNAQLTATPGATGTTIGFEGTQSSHGFGGDVLVNLENDEGLAWSATSTASPIQFTPEALEDFAGLRAQANAETEKKGSGTTFTLRYYSARVDVAKGPLVPASRGAKCQIGAKVYDTEPCPYTDGKLTNISDNGADLRIDFAAPITPKKVLVRGLHHALTRAVIFEGSSDEGVNWTQLARATAVSDYSELALSSSGAVESVRVRLEGDGDPKILGLREISFFE